jgi:hypothetical protein
MRNLHDLFNEASQSSKSTRLLTPYSLSYIMNGVKIERNEDSIVVYNTRRGNDFYRELSKVEYRMMCMLGWEVGACNIAIINAKRSIKRVQRHIQEELTGRNNKKRYDYLKECRSTFIEKYNQFKQEKWKYLRSSQS